MQHLGLAGVDAFAGVDVLGLGNEEVVRPAHQRLPAGEVAVQHGLVGQPDLQAPPVRLRRHQGHQVFMGTRAGERPVDEEEAGVERVFQRRPALRFRRRTSPFAEGGAARRRSGFPWRQEGGRVHGPALQGIPVSAAHELFPGSEQLADGGAEQHVAVVVEHLAVSAQPEGFEGVEHARPDAELRKLARRERGGQAFDLPQQHRRNRLELHATAHRPEQSARLPGQPVVQHDHVSLETGMVLLERAEHGNRAGQEALGRDGDQAVSGRHGGSEIPCSGHSAAFP